MAEHADTAENDRTPHTHGGTDAPECTPYGVQCPPEPADLDLEPLTEWLEDVLVEYDEQGQLFGTSGAGAYFLARHLARALATRIIPPAVPCRTCEHPEGYDRLSGPCPDCQGTARQIARDAGIKYIRLQVDGHTVVEFRNGARACSCGLERGETPHLRHDRRRTSEDLMDALNDTDAMRSCSCPSCNFYAPDYEQHKDEPCETWELIRAFADARMAESREWLGVDR